MPDTPQQFNTVDVIHLEVLVGTAWVDITGSTYEIRFTRTPLNLSTMTVNLSDATLDPARSDVIRPGREVRLSAGYATADPAPLFPGVILNGDVDYDIANRRTLVTMTAVMATTRRLSLLSRPNGVETLEGLRGLLWDTEADPMTPAPVVPFFINGNNSVVDPSTVTTVATVESASLLDQVHMTRDTVGAYAWIDSAGTLRIYDTAHLFFPTALVIDESVYTSIDVGYNTDDCVNTVTIVVNTINPTTGETEQHTYGPYADAASVSEWGEHPATYTIQLAVDSESAAAAVAASILAANATPAVRINSVTFPIETGFDATAGTDPARKAFLDLMDYVELINTAAGLDHHAVITQVDHLIRHDRWIVTLGFTPEDVIATPVAVPAPATTPVKTVGQLLRPVGEVTMWHGPRADVPAGWLVCDGSTFDAAAYPELNTLLGGNTLPNFTDRFPIGAGTKARGTTGGAATRTLSNANLPEHTHTIDQSNTAGTSGLTLARGNGTVNGTNSNPIHPANAASPTPVDILNPWRALWFIIRAV